MFQLSLLRRFGWQYVLDCALSDGGTKDCDQSKSQCLRQEVSREGKEKRALVTDLGEAFAPMVSVFALISTFLSDDQHFHRVSSVFQIHLRFEFHTFQVQRVNEFRIQ